MKIINVCGARPNFMKIAPLMNAYRLYPLIQPLIVHTGQHYDENMSALFFDELGISRPDLNLEVGSGSHAQQTAEVIKRFEGVVKTECPDVVLVVGDVNSTLACSLVACKLKIPVVHVEAGLRSFDRSMPEEINRLLTDAIADTLFVTEPSGEVNLRQEGIDLQRIHLVGNVMIDTLLKHVDRAKSSTIHQQLNLSDEEYGVITLHRPSNVDSAKTFAGIARAFSSIQEDMPLVFCMHPRTLKQATEQGLMKQLELLPRLQITPPLGYLDFLFLISRAAVILSDSGGIQEEATILNVPCLTIRENTERPITLTHGTNILAGTCEEKILSAYAKIDEIRRRRHTRPPLWDGKAAERIAAVISNLY